MGENIVHTTWAIEKRQIQMSATIHVVLGRGDCSPGEESPEAGKAVVVAITVALESNSLWLLVLILESRKLLSFATWHSPRRLLWLLSRIDSILNICL